MRRATKKFGARKSVYDPRSSQALSRLLLRPVLGLQEPGAVPPLYGARPRLRRSDAGRRPRPDAQASLRHRRLPARALGVAVPLRRALATIPMGTLLDRRDRTLLLSGSFVVWSIAIGVAGAAATFAVLLGARLLLGVASAAYDPASPSLVGDLVPVGKRGWALGVVDGGLLVGLALGYLLPAVITAFASWRLCFWVLAMAGFATAYGFMRLKEPERGPAMGPADEGERRASRAQRMVKQGGVRPSRSAILREEPRRMSMWEAAKYVVRVRIDLITVLGRALGASFLQGVATFMVVFLTGWYGLSQEGAYAGILGVGVGAIAGVLILGRTSDALLGRGWLHGRVLVGASVNFAAAVAFFAAFSTRSFAVALPLF